MISSSEEELLWEKGILGIDSPAALLNAVFYGNGKVLCLSGGRKHWGLKLSQFEFGDEKDANGEVTSYVVYSENGSKNRSGSYKDKTPNKIVKHYADPALKEHCYVFLLRLYFSKLPPKAFEKDVFYLKPKSSVSGDGLIWFDLVSVGRNTLAKFVKTMCSQVGILGHKTNHSLRATGTTRMFEAGVSDKIIQQRTGHCSAEALHLYERVSVEQQKAVLSILAGGKGKTLKEEENQMGTHPVCDDQKRDKQQPIFESLNNCTINLYM